MADGRLVNLKWRLNADGGGTAWWMIDYLSHVDDHEKVFDSLDELPESFASRIREDGRTEGEIRFVGVAPEDDTG